MNRSTLIPLSLFLLMPLACNGGSGDTSTSPTDDETGINTFMTVGDGDGDPGDGDGDGSGDGDGDGSGGMDMPLCGMVSIIPEYTPPHVMLVVDASGSMISNTWDHDLNNGTPEETRWKTLYGVVETVMDQFGPAMRAGIKRFPSETACDPNPCYNSTACTVTPSPEVTVDINNGAAILAAIPGPDDDGSSVEGGTPTTRGVNSAVTHLRSLSEEIPRYILLITDGAANCTPDLAFPALVEDYDETLAPTVQGALDDDAITTFVVGIDIIDQLLGVGPDGSPEANPYERLNEVALAGGAPKNMGNDPEKFFNATNQDELLTALGGIIDEITECVIDLSMTEEGPPDPIQVPFVQFTADGMTIPYLMDPADCDSMDGWTWLEYGVIVTFCGQYCDDFKTASAVFDGLYGCPPPG